MVDVSNVPHHQSVTEIAEVLCARTRKTDAKFFRILSVYYLSVMAACMRAKVRTRDRGEIALNNYVLAMAPSGFGKGVSTTTFEEELMSDFRQMFSDHVMPNRAEQNMWKLASRRAASAGTDDQTEYDKLAKEFELCGEYPFVFDGGSEPAIKQIRQMLLLADCGSINYQVDEIGLNLEKSGEALTTFLELYDQGRIKAKLTKNSSDNKRTKEIEGKTPANMLLFGTPSMLLDGAATEKKFYQLLDTGYARRCLFASGDPSTSMDIDQTPEEIYNLRINPANQQAISDWKQHFAYLADPAKINWTIDVPDDVGIALMSYQVECEQSARALPEYAEVQRTELMHRYFKALKVAGVFAFVEETLTMTLSHLNSAIKLVEESGASFQALLTREAPYMKLAKYIAAVPTEVTHADLLEALPFYRGSSKDRGDLITMATAWGYKQHIVIKKQFADGIELFSGETLKETSLDSVELAYSDDYAYNYEGSEAAFSDLHLLTQEPDLHWTNHAFEKNHRAEENVVPGFNLVVIDVDGETSLQTAHELLQDYVFMTYTTKRHTPEVNRFRLILPTNYRLELDQPDYKAFMDSLVEWLPFAGVDPSVNQRAKKWTTCAKGQYHYNLEGRLLDVLPFVPKTSKNEQHQKAFSELGSLDNLERWFAQQFNDGNRNNQMIKFALALVDTGMSYAEVEEKVLAFNGKIANGLTADELRRTVLVTVARKLQGSE